LPQPAAQVPQGGLRKRSTTKPENRGGVASNVRDSAPSGGGRRSGYQEESKQAAVSGELYDYGDGER